MKKRTICLSGVLLLTFSSCVPGVRTLLHPPQRLDAASVAGTWSGTVFQRDTASTYRVQLTLAPSAVVGTVIGSSAYPSLECGGQLVAVKRSGQTVVVRERLSSGQGQCLDGILLSLTPQRGGRLRYEFYQSGDVVLNVPNGVALLQRARNRGAVSPSPTQQH